MRQRQRFPKECFPKSTVEHEERRNSVLENYDAGTAEVYISSTVLHIPR